MKAPVLPLVVTLLSVPLVATSCAGPDAAGSAPLAVTYADVHAIFEKHCMECHSRDDPEGELVLEDYRSLMQGGEKGEDVIPGDASSSRLITLVEKRRMPMPKKAKKLSGAEIGILRAWIDAGARPGR